MDLLASLCLARWLTFHDQKSLVKADVAGVYQESWLEDISWGRVDNDIRDLRESIAASCTVVMVFPSSGTLTLRRRANPLLRCQNGTLSGSTAVSLKEVEERPTERAASLSEEEAFLSCPTGLLEAGQSWYREVVGC
jgi:hypothetical protein